MTQLNDHPEDPTGFRVEPDGDDWRWVRISDQKTRTGFATRDEACDDADREEREP